MARRENAAPIDPRRALPPVGEILAWPELRAEADREPRGLLREAVQRVLAGLRTRLRAGGAAPGRDAVAAAVRLELAAAHRDRLRPVLNATGIVLHTGLGRAVLPRGAAAALARLDRCCNLQIDLETGLRGKRGAAAEQLLCRLTGAEAAVVVNNNAAATLLMLAALCRGREVVVSRGQLIEIGGSYRLPDCVHQSGAALVEVGTTNRTHLRDYEAALSERTAAVLRVNPSNYRVVGFAAEVPVRELAGLKKGRDLLVLDDLGCGALVDLRPFGLPAEPTAPASIAAGADLCCFSGDKLIGGPQCGIVVGRADLVARLRKHPLMRMLRVGKLTYAALEAALRLFLEPGRLPRTSPTYAMLAAGPTALRRRANALARRIARERLALEARVVATRNSVGGGSLPGHDLPGVALAVRARGLSADRLAAALRAAEPPVVGRIEDDAVLLEMRTLLAGEDRAVLDALRAVAPAPAAAAGN